MTILPQYRVTLLDRAGRSEESVGMGNAPLAAIRAVLLNAVQPRSLGGLGMMSPVNVVGLRVEP